MNLTWKEMTEWRVSVSRWRNYKVSGGLALPVLLSSYMPETNTLKLGAVEHLLRTSRTYIVSDAHCWRSEVNILLPYCEETWGPERLSNFLSLYSAGKRQSWRLNPGLSTLFVAHPESLYVWVPCSAQGGVGLKQQISTTFSRALDSFACIEGERKPHATLEVTPTPSLQPSSFSSPCSVCILDFKLEFPFRGKSVLLLNIQ